MAEVLWLVHRLQQGTDHYRLNQMRIGAIGDLEQYALIVLGLRLRIAR